MAQPLAPNTQTFERDQTVAFTARYWDTTSTAVRLSPARADRYTAAGSGVEFALFNLLDAGFAPAGATPALYRDAIELQLSEAAGSTQAVLGYDADGAYRTGLVQTVYDYWGAGAPAGGSRAKQTLMKFSGVVREAVTAGTLVFAGQGTVAAFVTRANGAVAQLAAGTLHEPHVDVNLATATATTIRDEWGYVFNDVPVALAAGERVEIYYWHNGEPWGGLAAKLLPRAIRTDAGFLSDLRDAAVVGTSFLAKEAAPLPATVLPYVKDMSMTRTAGAVTEMTLTVSLAPADEANGYAFDPVEGALVDNANGALRVRKGRLVHFEGGFARPDGSLELYPRFTGYVEDVTPTAGTAGTATIQCRSLEGKLTGPFDLNTPDYLSYHAHGYILRERAAEPVFGVPAFDLWPLETIVADLCTRADVDAYSLGFPIGDSGATHGQWRFADAASGTPYYGQRLLAARALANPARPISVERQANYGNVMPLVKDYLPKDDAYLFPPQPTQRLYDRVKTITDQYGYDFSFNAEGQAVLAARNNAAAFQYMTASGAYGTMTPTGESVAVSAVGGVVFRASSDDAPWSKVVEGHFARLDLYAGIGVDPQGRNGGLLDVRVEVADGLGGFELVGTSRLSTYADTTESFFYDSAVHADGTNATLFRILSLPFDHYRVTLTPAGPDAAAPAGSACAYRLNGVAVYERDPEASYYTRGRLPATFSTLGNVLKLTPVSTTKDMRNFVLVVGGRKATVTDSAKLNDVNASNPTNPEQEFNVAVAADPFSIYDPTSANFGFGKRMTVIFNDKVADSDFAKYLVRTILFQYRVTKMAGKLTHTVIPTLDVRDAMYVVEERHGSVDHLLWVSSFTEHWEPGKATTDVDLLSVPELPSYQPRENIDVDRLFPDPATGKGLPAIDVQLAYANLYGDALTNDDLASVTMPYAAGAFQAIPTSGAFSLARGAIPETIFLGWNAGNDLFFNSAPGAQSPTQRGGWSAKAVRALVNNPYRHVFSLASWTDGAPVLTLDVQEGDGTPGLYDEAYYRLRDQSDILSRWSVNYDVLGARVGKNPFYDPYTSELGNLVTLDFTLLVSGRVRVGIYDANRTAGYETPVAWLTAPTATPDEPEAHWQFHDAGRASFAWDGSDNIGFWNVLHSFDYAQEIKGTFGDESINVGRGFYAWNDSTSDLHTQVGDLDARNFGPDGAPYFTLGRYGRFYAKIEVLNDDLVKADLRADGRADPRAVRTDALVTSVTPEGSTTPILTNSAPQLHVYTHLGEPTQVGIRIQDWVATRAWTRGADTTEADWGPYSTPDPEASIAAGKPVRVTFVPHARRGPLWNNDPVHSSVKLTREVHLKATVFDQFWTFAGRPWQEFHPKFPVGAAENKSVTSRMYHDEDHTLRFEDTEFRTGAALAATEWIFDPTLFIKDFGTGLKEALRYGDYEQLEALPSHDAQRLGGSATSARANLLMAYLSYVFYLSAHTLDRSGRRQFCLNAWTDDAGKARGWIDKSKILTPAWRAASADPASAAYAPDYLARFETRGADVRLSRTIFARQWKEAFWADPADPRSLVALHQIVSPHERKFVQPTVRDFEPTAGVFQDAVHGLTDTWWTEWQRYGSGAAQMMQTASPLYQHNTTPPVLVGVTNTQVCPKQFGTWGFDRPGVEGFFRPNPCRDFHPYMRYPFMPDLRAVYLTTYDNPFDGTPDVMSAAASHASFAVRDYAAQSVWYGYAFSDAFALANTTANRTNPRPIFDNWLYGARCERTVEELGAEGPTWKADSNYIMSTDGVGALFDYRRQDELDRFDQYRGVISRAPYADRKGDGKTNIGGEAWWSNGKKRAASAAPVKAAGVYLLNVGRYSDYTVAPTHEQLAATAPVHYVSKVTDWFRIEFPHEYVWQSARYFPVTALGGAAYMLTRDEYTRVSTKVGHPWSRAVGVTAQGLPTTQGTQILYDAGAWTGWKPDVPAGGTSGWTARPKLRWSEVYPLVAVPTGGSPIDEATWDDVVNGHPATTDTWITNTFFTDFRGNAPRTHMRLNVFDEYRSLPTRARLGVGPELPEYRALVLNLSLPTRLAT